MGRDHCPDGGNEDATGNQPNKRQDHHRFRSMLLPHRATSGRAECSLSVRPHFAPRLPDSLPAEQFERPACHGPLPATGPATRRNNR